MTVSLLYEYVAGCLEYSPSAHDTQIRISPWLIYQKEHLDVIHMRW